MNSICALGVYQEVEIFRMKTMDKMKLKLAMKLSKVAKFSSSISVCRKLFLCLSNSLLSHSPFLSRKQFLCIFSFPREENGYYWSFSFLIVKLILNNIGRCFVTITANPLNAIIPFCLPSIQRERERQRGREVVRCTRWNAVASSRCHPLPGYPTNTRIQEISVVICCCPISCSSYSILTLAVFFHHICQQHW